ncbi:MAG: hypothetical protein M5U09_21435 [Gammaproteobacteria bacterium]|nr:hypothetical protein [Gammaproteobacteria bacterium]
MDHDEGLGTGDEEIARKLRRAGKPVHVVVNKAEGVAEDLATSEFRSLGFDRPWAISALRGDRVESMLEELLAPYGDEEACSRPTTASG